MRKNAWNRCSGVWTSVDSAVYHLHRSDVSTPHKQFKLIKNSAYNSMAILTWLIAFVVVICLVIHKANIIKFLSKL